MPKGQHLKRYRRKNLKDYITRRELNRKGPEAVMRSAEERLNALELRKKGYTYAEIAKELDISYARAAAYIRKALQQIYEIEGDFAKQLRELELQRLDALLKSVWDDAVEGNYQALDRVLRILDQRAKLSGLSQAISNNVFIQTQNNNIDNRTLTLEQVQEKRKQLSKKLSEIKSLVE